jgi:hypothetical protein
MRVIDIQETQNVSFCVKWANDFDWCIRTQYFLYENVWRTPVPSSFERKANGYIFVAPFTTLQSPDASTIDVNVYIKSNNIEYAMPTSEYIPPERAITESYDISVESQIIPQQKVVSDENVSCMELSVPQSSNEYTSSFYMGERILSFRTLLKRFMWVESISVGAQAAPSVHTYQRTIIPPISHAYGALASGDPYNLFDYLRYAYLGVRGSVRWRLTTHSDFVDTPTNMVTVRLMPPATSNAASGATTSTIATTSLPRLEGAITHIPASNGGVEWELPFYATSMFVLSFASDFTGTLDPTTMSNFFSRNYELNVCVPPASASEYYLMAAAGEDFDLVRFMGAPFFSL